MISKKQKGSCAHNKSCAHVPGGYSCRGAVESATCTPSMEVRIDLKLPLTGVDYKDFVQVLDRHKGRMPVRGFVSK